MLSGYQGGEDIGAMILDAVALVKLRNPAAIYCCDPVLGDADRGYYVRPGIPELMRRQVVPAAQIITPNQFELESLTGRAVSTMDELLNAADARAIWDLDVVLVTSVVRRDGPPETIDMVAIDADGAWLVTTPRLPQTFTGSGTSRPRPSWPRCWAGRTCREHSRTRGGDLWAPGGHGCLRSC